MFTFQTLNGVHIVYHEAKRQTALVNLVNGTAFIVQVSFHLIEDFFFFITIKEMSEYAWKRMTFSRLRTCVGSNVDCYFP